MHDSTDNFLRAEDQQFMEIDIMKALSVPALVSKPKILLIQVFIINKFLNYNIFLIAFLNVGQALWKGMEMFIRAKKVCGIWF